MRPQIDPDLTCKKLYILIKMMLSDQKGIQIETDGIRIQMPQKTDSNTPVLIDTLDLNPYI